MFKREILAKQNIQIYERHACAIQENITLVKPKTLGIVVRSVIRDEFKNAFDVIEDNIVGKGEKDISLLFLQENLFSVILEEIFIFIETDGKEVEEISNIDIVSDGTEVSSELGVEIQHVFEVTRLATTTLNVGAEDLNFLGENLDLVLCPDHQPILPDVLVLKQMIFNTQKD